MLVGAYPFEDQDDPKNIRKTIQVTARCLCYGCSSHILKKKYVLPPNICTYILSELQQFNIISQTTFAYLMIADNSFHVSLSAIH